MPKEIKEKKTGEFDPVDKTALEYNPQVIDDKRGETRSDDIWGTFLRVTAIPTHVPRKLRDSIAINESTAKIYYYDFKNNQWRTVGATTVYGGVSDSTANSVTLPTGWSIAKSGTSMYTVTHNLNNSSYAVLVDADTGFTSSLSRGANSFSYTLLNLSGSAAALAHNFSLILI